MLPDLLEEVPARLTDKERETWLQGLKNVTLGSDGFFPFRDNIDRAAKSGVKYVVQPGGSVRDDIVINSCNEYDMVHVTGKDFSSLNTFYLLRPYSMSTCRGGYSMKISSCRAQAWKI